MVCLDNVSFVVILVDVEILVVVDVAILVDVVILVVVILVIVVKVVLVGVILIGKMYHSIMIKIIKGMHLWCLEVLQMYQFVTIVTNLVTSKRIATSGSVM